MPVAGGGFEQACNAQVKVAADSLPVVTNDVVQAANDKRRIEPVLQELERLPEELGQTETLLADSSYFSEANVTACAESKVAPLIAWDASAITCPGKTVSPKPRQDRRSRPPCKRWCIGWAPRRPVNPCPAQAHAGTGVRHHPIGDGLSTIPPARPQ